jgi:hypothetical protein
VDVFKSDLKRNRVTGTLEFHQLPLMGLRISTRTLQVGWIRKYPPTGSWRGIFKLHQYLTSVLLTSGRSYWYSGPSPNIWQHMEDTEKLVLVTEGCRSDFDSWNRRAQRLLQSVHDLRFTKMRTCPKDQPVQPRAARTGTAGVGGPRLS